MFIAVDLNHVRFLLSSQCTMLSIHSNIPCHASSVLVHVCLCAGPFSLRLFLPFFISLCKQMQSVKFIVPFNWRTFSIHKLAISIEKLYSTNSTLFYSIRSIAQYKTEMNTNRFKWIKKLNIPNWMTITICSAERAREKERETISISNGV